RRDGVRRRDDRSEDSRGVAGGDAQPHDDHHRPPPFHDRAGRRGRRARRGPRRRARDPHRARDYERRLPRDPGTRAARARARRGGGRVRVRQPGAHLNRARGAGVDDWSWRRTKRRLGVLYRLARPYKPRTTLALLALLGATAVALAPPYLVGLTVDHVQSGDTSALPLLVGAFVAAGVLGVVLGYPQTYFTGWAGERLLASLRAHRFGHLQ